MEVRAVQVRKTLRLISSILGLVGVLGMLFGVVVWNIFDTFKRPEAYLPLIIGGALFVVFLAVNIPIIIAEGRRQRALIGVNVFVMIIVASFVLLVTNYLGFKYFKTFDLTRARIYALSDLTKKTLANLQDEITAYVFFMQGSSQFDYVKRGLTKYTEESDKIKVEYVDIDRDVSKVKMIKDKIGYASPDTVVMYEEKTGRSKLVKSDEIFDMENYGPFSNIPPRITRYKGEEAFTAAIINVTAEKQLKIYFLKGHGEKQVEGPGSFEQTGYGPLADDLKRLNYRVATLNFVEKEKIPEDCDILVIGGPQKPFTPVEVEILDGYLKNGGRMLAMLDPVAVKKADGSLELARLGIEDMLEKYGIRVGMDIVCYPYSIPPDRYGKIYCKDYTWHDIVKDFKKAEYAVHFPLARSVSYTTAKDKSIETNGLISTLSEGWAEEDIRTLASESGAEYNAGKDTGGPITVASAAWQPGEGGMRLVVIGDSDFATRAFALFAPTNQNLFENCINWLAERMGLISIAPKTIQKIRINATQVERNAVFFISVVGLPILVLVIGAFVFFMRRR